MPTTVCSAWTASLITRAFAPYSSRCLPTATCARAMSSATARMPAGSTKRIWQNETAVAYLAYGELSDGQCAARGGRALPQHPAFLHRGIGEAMMPCWTKASPAGMGCRGAPCLHGQCRHRLFRPDHARPATLFRRQPGVPCHDAPLQRMLRQTESRLPRPVPLLRLAAPAGRGSRHRGSCLCARHARRGWNKTGNKQLQASTSATRHSTR